MSFPLGRQTSQDKLAGRKAGSPRGRASPSGVGAQSPLTLSMVAAPKPARVAVWDEGDREDRLQGVSQPLGHIGGLLQLPRQHARRERPEGQPRKRC